jgi:hypothetical protein
VKFIVKVKLIENRVNSHVGSVYDTQKRTVGRTLKMEITTRPSTPVVDDGAFSAVFIAARVVWTASGALDTTAAELSTSDETASGTAMMDRRDRVLYDRKASIPTISIVTRSPSRTGQ